MREPPLDPPPEWDENEEESDDADFEDCDEEPWWRYE